MADEVKAVSIETSNGTVTVSAFDLIDAYSISVSKGLITQNTIDDIASFIARALKVAHNE